MKSCNPNRLFFVYQPGESVDDAFFVIASTPEDAALLYVREVADFEGERTVAVEEAPAVGLTHRVCWSGVIDEFTIRRQVEVTMINEPEPNEPDEDDDIVRLHPHLRASHR